MTPEARKAARKAAKDEADKKHKRAIARLDGEPAPEPEFKATDGEDDVDYKYLLMPVRLPNQ